MRITTGVSRTRVQPPSRRQIAPVGCSGDALDVDLSGTWRAAPADAAGRRDYQDPTFDDTSWALATVPGHWRSNPALADSDGPVLHRTTFAGPAPVRSGADDGGPGDRRSWLMLDGIFYTSDVWLDGTYLGDTEGYFFPHSFEVTEALAAPASTRSPSRWPAPGLRPHRQARPHRRVPALGPTRPGREPRRHLAAVRLEQSGPVRIRHARLRCGDINDERAIVVAPRRARHRRGPVGRPRHHDRRGAGAASRSRSAATSRWRPARTGSSGPSPCPSRALVAPRPRRPGHVRRARRGAHRADGRPASDERSWPLGLRTVELRDWIATVNGERLFLKGTNRAHPDGAGRGRTAEIAGDIELAREPGSTSCGCTGTSAGPSSTPRPTRPACCSGRTSPCSGATAAPSARRPGARPGRRSTCWPTTRRCSCGAATTSRWRSTSSRRRWPTVAPPAPRGADGGGPALPSWNSSLLDRAIKTVLERDDGTRPVVAHSGVLPHLPQLDGTDSHL